MACDRGWIDFSITLAPTMPPRVQYLSARSALPLVPALASAMAQVAGAIGRPEAPSALEASLFADDGTGHAGRAQVAAAMPWGRCEITKTIEGDGQSRAVVRLACERGTLDAVVAADAATGRLTRLTLAPTAGSCLP